MSLNEKTMFNIIIDLFKAVFCQLYILLWIFPKYLIKEHLLDPHKPPVLQTKGQMTKKTVLITGGSKGVGLGAVEQFLKLGCDIIVGCRNVDYAEEVFKKLCVGTDSHHQRIQTFYLDLGCWQSIHSFATTVRELDVDLHVLVNNAGIRKTCGRTVTDHGDEIHLGCNYLGHVLLTHLLFDQLKSAADHTGEASRIVNVSSATHSLSAIMNGLQDVSLNKFYCPELAYANSKTALLIFSQYLNQKFQSSGINIKVLSLHPGVVFTELAIQQNLSIIVECGRLLFKSSDQGGDSLVHAALSPELDKVDLTGVYLENNKPVDIGSYCKNPVLQKELWDKTQKILNSENICGF